MQPHKVHLQLLFHQQVISIVSQSIQKSAHILCIIYCYLYPYSHRIYSVISLIISLTIRINKAINITQASNVTRYSSIILGISESILSIISHRLIIPKFRIKISFSVLFPCALRYRRKVPVDKVICFLLFTLAHLIPFCFRSLF